MATEAKPVEKKEGDEKKSEKETVEDEAMEVDSVAAVVTGETSKGKFLIFLIIM